MRLFIGLDVSFAKTTVCAISEYGKIVKETQVASEPEAVASLVLALDGCDNRVGGWPSVTMAASRSH